MKAKTILIFLLGVITGAGGMYASFKSINDKKIEKKVNDELAKIRGDRKKPEEEQEPKKESPEPPDKKEVPVEEKDLTKYSQALGRTDYTKAVVKDKVTTMSDVVEEKIEQIAEKKPTKKTKVPKKVTQEEYDSAEDDERMELRFYSDGVLADLYDNAMDPTVTMGATNLKNFKSTYDTIYIYNYADSMFYEIEYSNSKYSDIAGGDIRN